MSELGIRSGDNSNVVQMLEEALQRQSLLLVLDNFEHVVEAADLVARTCCSGPPTSGCW